MGAKRPRRTSAWKRVALDFLLKVAAAGLIQVVKDWLS